MSSFIHIRKSLPFHNFDRRCSSSTSSSDQPNDNNESSNNNIHFPWRHSPTPTARILDNDDYSGMPNNFRARFVRRLIAARELNLGAFHAIPLPFGMAHEWEEELSGNFSVAFGLAMRELIHTLFPGSSATYKEDDQSLWIDTTASIEESADDEDDNQEESSPQTTLIENNIYLTNMMDKLLVQQYEHLYNIPSQDNNLSIKLVIRPIEAKLQNIFAVPMLTREIVEAKPHLRGGYQRLEAVFKETKSYSEVKQKTYELAEEVGLDSAKRTVIAEATLTCMEYFQVKDTQSGVILQGMDDEEEEEEVVHLVRFELVTDRGEEAGVREGGNWKLIDVDDLLEGNVFH